MSGVRLHLDEDAEAYALVRALRTRGVDLTTASEAALVQATDEEQLVWATREGRALFSYNASDFRPLHTAWLNQGRHHAGIILAEQQRHSVGETTRRILRLLSAKGQTGMNDQIEFLSRWG